GTFLGRGLHAGCQREASRVAVGGGQWIRSCHAAVRGLEFRERGLERGELQLGAAGRRCRFGRDRRRRGGLGQGGHEGEHVGHRRGGRLGGGAGGFGGGCRILGRVARFGAGRPLRRRRRIRGSFALLRRL